MLHCNQNFLYLEEKHSLQKILKNQKETDFQRIFSKAYFFLKHNGNQSIFIRLATKSNSFKQNFLKSNMVKDRFQFRAVNSQKSSIHSVREHNHRKNDEYCPKSPKRCLWKMQSQINLRIRRNEVRTTN